MNLLLKVAIFIRNEQAASYLTLSQKLLLVILASHIGENNKWIIKQTILSKECGISPRQLIRNLAILCEYKIIEIEKITTKNGKQSAYKFAQNFDTLMTPMSPSEDLTMCHPCHLVKGLCDTHVTKVCDTHVTKYLPPPYLAALVPQGIPASEISPKRTLQENLKDKRTINIVLFQEFWCAYPRHENKKKAMDIWKRKKLDKKAELIISDTINRKMNHQPWLDGFIPHATTYLNGERWDDNISEKISNGKNNLPESKQNRASKSLDEYLRRNNSKNNERSPEVVNNALQLTRNNV